jgi:hypothetical protein
LVDDVAADVEVSTAQMDVGVVIKDGSGEWRVQKRSFVREEFGQHKAIANKRGFRVPRMYGGAPSVGLETAVGDKLETMVFKGFPCPR